MATRISLIIVGVVILTEHTVLAQRAIKFEVRAGDYDRHRSPLSIDLSSTDLQFNNQALQLFRLDGKKETPVPSQLEQGRTPRLWFILDVDLKKGQKQTYVLRENSEGMPSEPAIALQQDHAGLIVSHHGKPVLNYAFAEVYPPPGINPIFKRSGFIHPLWSPSGEVLTRIQAPDHYHHYGLWGPWTETHIKGREVDFWNLVKGEGTVRFAKFISQQQGPIFGGFSALQEHVDFGGRGEDQIAINEVLSVRAWNADPQGKVWLIDYTSVMNCPLDSGILLDAYRYGGGIGYRATESWTKENSTVLTSDGKDRLTADGTKARWCIVEGASQPGRSGILFMGHPSNREYPEPMRVWPVDANGGRGDVYFEFCPIRHHAWNLEKGNDYSQKYRLLVFDGSLTAAQAEQHWQDFARPPQVVVIP